ncbi:MAG: hypothetical protein ACXV5T_07415 [Halobacteriota archaeon]
MRAHVIVSLCVVAVLVAVLFACITTTPPAEAISPSQTICYVPQAGSTWINKGTAGGAYNAYVSSPDLFKTKNGHPYWGDTGRNDFVSIPAGSATNNQNVMSMEMGFHFSGATGQRFQKLWDKAYGGYMVEIDTDKGLGASYLTLYRATTGGSHARWYIPCDTILRAGHDYYVQIAWDSSAGPGKESFPAIWIGEDAKAPVRQTHWDLTGGPLQGTGSWYNDAPSSANLANTASGTSGTTSVKTAWLNGGFYVFRQYTGYVDFSNGGHWNTDKVAWTTATAAAKQAATSPSKETSAATSKVVAKSVKSASNTTPSTVKQTTTPALVKA